MLPGPGIPRLLVELFHFPVHACQLSADNERHGCVVIASLSLSLSLSLAYIVCSGQIKNIFTTGLGLVIFGDVVYNAGNMFGLLIGIAGRYVVVCVPERERENMGGCLTID
jgi:hypothetical protein